MLNTISIPLKKWGRTRPKPGDRRSQCSPGTVGSITALTTAALGRPPPISVRRLTSHRGFWNLHELSGFHVVDVAVYRDVIGNQRVISNTRDILDHAPGVIGERQPIDVIAFCSPRLFAR